MREKKEGSHDVIDGVNFITWFAADFFIHHCKPRLNNVGRLLVVRGRRSGKQGERKRREIDRKGKGDLEKVNI